VRRPDVHEAHNARRWPPRAHAAAGDHLELIRRAETATNVWWEMVETKAVPIVGTERPVAEVDRIPGIIDPDDELA